MQTLLLGVGNTILTDDAVGIRVVREVAVRLAARGRESLCEVLETERGGLDLLELLAGHKRALLVDAIVLSDHEVGTILLRELQNFRVTQHLNGAHGVDLPTAVAMGRALGESMPDDVAVLAIVVKDPFTLGEQMSPEVESVVASAAEQAIEWLDIAGS